MKPNHHVVEYALLVVKLEVFSQIIDVDFKIVYDESCGASVGDQVIDVPAWQVVHPEYD